MAADNRHPQGQGSPVAQRLRRVQERVHRYHSNQGFAHQRLKISGTRWQNMLGGMPLSLPVALKLCQITPGLTLDYLYRGIYDGLPLTLARVLGEDGEGAAAKHRL